MQLVQADDRGRYRLFWLPPGEYSVCARPLDLRHSSEMLHVPPPSRFGTYEQQVRSTVTAVNTSELQDDGTVVEGRYVPVCFPGTTTERHAAAIRVDAGQQVSGIDINVGPSLVRTFRVRGRVVNGANGRPSAASLQLIPRDPSAILLIPTGGADEDGSFDVGGALPGPLYVAASSGGLNGLIALDIAGNDVDGVVVPVWPGASIRGRIRLDGRGTDGGRTDLSGLVVTIRRHPPVNGLPEASPAARGANRTGADGSFTLNNVRPGRHLIEVLLRDELYVQSIMLGGRNVLRDGLHVEGPVPETLDIVVSPRGGSVAGTVFDTARQLAGNVTVVARPEAALQERHDLYRVSTTDSSGRFVLQGLAPGVYELFAWEAVDPGAWRDPEFMRPYAGRGRTVRVAAGGRSAMDLEMIPGWP